VRQAYDEFARPARLLLWLSVLPLTAALTVRRGLAAPGLVAGASIVLAAAGRMLANGRQVFPLRTVLAAPFWILERAICAWLALGSRMLWGGIPYGGRILARAATPVRTLRRQVAKDRELSRGTE
jgi:hypothetical protein